MTSLLKTLKALFYQKAIANVLVFGVVTTIIYAGFIKNLDSSLIRELDDKAFDLISIFLPVDEKINEKITIFKVDDEFLKSEGLMSETNQTNYLYGEFIPKRYVTEFIEKLDKMVAFGQIKPKLLFIDYTMDSPQISPLDIQNLTAEDLINKLQEEQNFINQLNEDRDYPIYFTHHKNYNYIEKAVHSKNIKFVSTMHRKESSIIRRYESYIERKNEKGELQKYYYAPLHFLDLNLSHFSESYNIVNNRFIYQDDMQNKIQVLSLKEDLLSRNVSDINGSMIFLGEARSDSLDQHHIRGGKKEFGINIIANNVMSVKYFNSQLTLLPLFPSLIIIFIIAVISRILSLLLSNRMALLFKSIKTVNHTLLLSISFFLFVFFLLILSTLVSWLFLLYGKIWFSCAIGYVVFYLIKLIL